MGSSIVLGQFAFVAAGTFEYFSWDIMEPICYLMTFGNFTAGYAFLILSKKDLELASVHEKLTARFKRSACARRGIDLNEH